MTQQAQTKTEESKAEVVDAQPVQQTALAQKSWQEKIAAATGGATKPEHINSRLRFFSTPDFHLISPGASVSQVPDGTSVVFSTVQVDIERETYDVGGDKRGLAKSALERIAAALGISWSPTLSRRMDDRSDPHYCAWRAVGTLRNFDGTYRTITAEKEMDMRDGSATVAGLRAKFQDDLAKWKAKTYKYEPKSPEVQISEMRKHIQAHAESKARLRAIRSIGLSASYTKDELALPFVTAALQFHGRSENPESRRIFANAIAQNFLGSNAVLYGGDSAPQGATAPALPPAEVFAPPPVNTTPPDEDVANFGARKTAASSTDEGKY